MEILRPLLSPYPGYRMSLRSGEEIARLLRRGEEGARVDELCAEFRISRATLFRIRARYGSHVDGLSRVLELERAERSARRGMRQLRAELRALRDLVQRRLCSVDERRRAARWLAQQHGLSERRSCELLGLHRSTLRRGDP